MSLNWDADVSLLAGVDEAGRGPLAGPVVAAAVMLDVQSPIDGLADSKKLSAKRREALYDVILSKALCVSCVAIDAQTVDRINVLAATMLAMQRAVEGLRLKPQLVLVDGNRLPTLSVRAEAIVQGDDKVAAISAASIVAKVTRDRMMDEADIRYPGYGFSKHKGYGTRAHLAALQSLGPCPLHRLTFAPVSKLSAPCK